MNINYKKLKLPNFTTILLRLQTDMERDGAFLKRYRDKVKEAREKRYYAITDVDLEFDCFMQVWGNTCTGFDVDENHEAMCGGDMMTEVYTTIVHERITSIYYVFFNDELCYKVYFPTEKFFIDMHDHHMSPLSTAEMLYENTDKSFD